MATIGLACVHNSLKLNSIALNARIYNDYSWRQNNLDAVPLVKRLFERKDDERLVRGRLVPMASILSVSKQSGRASERQRATCTRPLAAL